MDFFDCTRCAGRDDGIRVVDTIDSVAIVDISSVCDFNYANDHHIILDFTDDSVVPDAVSPKSCKLTTQRSTTNSWVVEATDSFKIRDDATLPSPIDFSKLFIGCSIISILQFKKPLDLLQWNRWVALSDDLKCVSNILLIFEPLDQSFTSETCLVSAG